jgi:hypothetical protein
MRQIASYLNITILILVTGSCIIPYEIGTQEYDKVIVVDGIVTTEFKKHSVRLSYTSPISFSEYGSLQNALQGADVWVENSNGAIYSFNEHSPGNYRSDIDFEAKEEYDYQLFFRTSEGKLYQSTKNKPIPAPPIDSIYDRYAELIPVNSTVQEAGIQFFLDSHDPTGKAKNFRYEWEETYKIVTPYDSRYEYDFDLGEIVVRETPINVCYSSNISTSLIIGTSVGSSANRVAELPIQFVSGETDILRNRYSILVRQFAVNNDTYNYYQRMKSSERQGTLFDEQQGSIIGNVSSVDNPNETVLGNFEVSGVSSLRVFFDLDDLDDKLLYPNFRYRCVTDNLIGTSINEALNYLQSNQYNIVGLDVEPPVTLATTYCTDCTWYATDVKPDFWTDS